MADVSQSTVLAAAAAGLGLACFCRNRSSPDAVPAALDADSAAALKKQLVEQGYCVVPA